MFYQEKESLKRSPTPEFIMIGGKGPESYNQHSSYQGTLLEAIKAKVDEAISAKFDLDLISNRFIVAEFGCASGPNTFVAVQNIIDAVKNKYQKQTCENIFDNIEFQVYFNDFSTNDFNTLFQSLPPDRGYYSAGVPGSFFERVLPKQSFHVGVINYALHFISRIPKEIIDRNSPSWNKDMHCTWFNAAVKKAYLEQYAFDTNNLLDARAEEIVLGGLMFLSGSCVRKGVKMSETIIGMSMDFIGDSLNDLARQGLIEQEKVDSFNIPVYNAGECELRHIIEKNGKFIIEAFEDIIHPNSELPLDSKFIALAFKAAFGETLSTNFGVEAISKAFELVEFKAHENISRLKNAKPGMQYLIVLRKK